MRVVLELKDNPHTGEPMGDKWPKNLRGSRKVRFDLPNREGRPRYRLIYRNQPEEGAVATVVVLAIGERDRMIAYARASKRLTARIAEGGLPDTT